MSISGSSEIAKLIGARQSAQGNESVLSGQNNFMAQGPRLRSSAVQVGRI